MNRPTTSPTSLFHSQNSQASENLATISSASRRDSETIVNDNFYFSDYLNNSGGEKEDQSVNQDDNLGDPQNFGGTSAEDTSVSSNNKSKTESAKKVISYDENNDEEFMPDLEKSQMDTSRQSFGGNRAIF